VGDGANHQLIHIDMYQYSVQKSCSGELVERLQNPGAERRKDRAIHKVIGEQSMALAIDQPSLAQQPQMVRDGRLFHRQRRFQVADAHLARAARQHRQDLNANRMRDDQQIVGKLLGYCGTEQWLIRRTAAALARFSCD